MSMEKSCKLSAPRPKDVDDDVYLGETITETGVCEGDIRQRICKACCVPWRNHHQITETGKCEGDMRQKICKVLRAFRRHTIWRSKDI